MPSGASPDFLWFCAKDLGLGVTILGQTTENTSEKVDFPGKCVGERLRHRGHSRHRARLTNKEKPSPLAVTQRAGTRPGAED